MSETPEISFELAEKLAAVLKEHFEYHTESSVVIVSEDGNCFAPDKTNDAWNHMREAKVKAYIVTKDGNGYEFTGSKKQVAPIMTADDKKRKANVQNVINEEEMRAKEEAEKKAKEAQEAADQKAKEEADAKAKAEQEAAELKEKEEAEVKEKAEQDAEGKAKETKESKAKATK